MNARLAIINAEYIEGYMIQFIFNDGREQLVNFENYLKTRDHPQHRKYCDISNFKKFRIDNSDAIVWGKSV